MIGLLRAKKVLLSGIVIAIFYWFFEAFMHSEVFKMGDFKDHIWPENVHELWMRLFTFITIVIFSGYAQHLLTGLEKSMKKIKILKGLLPICSSCKKIRNDRGYWEQVEEYIGEHSEAEFTHGICPECKKKLYPDLYKEEKGAKQ
ncbi:MAG: hypothetical protein JW827_10505 [Spirochaetes bacterium]|nr:hypothetical protein [Spirochaetota bacterium]